MSNMSYCRFQNTLNDLHDCYDHMEHTPESEEEQRDRVRLIRLCMTIAEEYSWVVEAAEVAKKKKKERDG